MFSGHLPTTNKFTIQNPATKTYKAGEQVLITLSFPFEIVADTSGGSPRLHLDINGTTRYADLEPITDPKKLTFSYTFVNGDNDNDGITITSLDLNGSTLQFDKDGTLTNCDVSTVANKNLPTVTVDTASPIVSLFKLTNMKDTNVVLGTGKKLNFILVFNEKVYLHDTTPSFDITFDTGIGTAVYKSGSGTNTLSFEYTITSSVHDTNGYNDISALDLGTGSITDAVGNIANLDYSAFIASIKTDSEEVKVGGQFPSIVSITIPESRTYAVAENLDFIFEFDREVVVTGMPSLDLTLSGSNPSLRKAQYLSAPNPSRFVTFRYTTVPGDVDADGITMQSSLNNNSGTANIVDSDAPGLSFFSDTNNTFPLPDTSGIILNAIRPQAISVVRNNDITPAQWGTPAVDDVFIIGQELLITVGFNTTVFVDQNPGKPYLPIQIGAKSARAYYLSGSGQPNLVFKYVIEEGDEDTDGALGISNIELNNGHIYDAHSTNILTNLPVTELANTKVDGIRPVLQQVTIPDDQVIYSNTSPYTRTQFVFKAQWSEPVHYSEAGTISMTVNGANRPLTSTNNDTNIINHAPSTNFPTNFEGGIVIGSSISVPVVTDKAGNTTTSRNFTAPDVSTLKIDTKPATIVDITPISPPGSYKSGESIDFAVTFSEPVTIVRNGTYPRIQLSLESSTTRYMTATTNGTGLTHTYRYTVANNDKDSDGISSTTTHGNNGASQYARDAGRNNTTQSIAKTFPGYLVDTQAPTFTVTRPSNGTYETGDTLKFILAYNEPITVDTTGGTPKISVLIGPNTRDFLYSSQTGNNLEFTYTLQADDFDTDGLPSSINTLNLNGGTIKDTAGNNSGTSFTTQNLSNIFVMFPDTKVWFQTTNTNKAKGPSSATYSGAIGVLDNCGSPCRRFDGDDSISMNLTNVKTVFIALKTPPIGANYSLLDGSLILTDDGSDFTAQFFGTISQSVNGTSVGAMTTLSPDTTYVLQIEYGGINYNGSVIDNLFMGSVGEVMVITGDLTPEQKTEIQNYLQGKFN